MHRRTAHDFAPPPRPFRTCVKDFQNLSMFKHEVEAYTDAAILTLRAGNSFGKH